MPRIIDLDAVVATPAKIKFGGKTYTVKDPSSKEFFELMEDLDNVKEGNAREGLDRVDNCLEKITGVPRKVLDTLTIHQRGVLMRGLIKHFTRVHDEGGGDVPLAEKPKAGRKGKTRSG